jgi:predicted esterase
MKIIIISCFLLAFLQNSPVNTPQLDEFNLSFKPYELLNEASIKTFNQIIPDNEAVEWSVYVPNTYKQERPAGVLVFISADNSGKIPNIWKEIMDKHNLIWIGANESGNKVDISKRIAYAILAVVAVDKNYKIDPERIYISGFSGGGRVSSMVAIQYAHIFKGAIYICGANFWGMSVPKQYKEIMMNSFVFITGTEDFNLADTKNVYNAYMNAGIQNVKLINVPRMSHENPSKITYEEAVKFLDSREF